MATETDDERLRDARRAQALKLLYAEERRLSEQVHVLAMAIAALTESHVEIMQLRKGIVR